MMKSLAEIYGLALKGKDFLYRAGLADRIHLNVPVISVGNLSVGGTGKTPVTEFLLRETKRHGLKTLVVSRNYKAESHGIHRVDLLKKNGARYFGDEPFWLAQKHPQFPVYVGPTKAWTAVQALKENEVDFVIVDDGFQHRGLHRDFDCVLLDATAPEASEKLLPAGRFREDFSALERANLVIITKVNWVPTERVERLKQKIPKDVEVAEMRFELKLGSTLPMQSSVIAFCGIGRPEVFRQSLEQLSRVETENLQLNFMLKDFLAFDDHHLYSKKDVKNILRQADQNQCEKILTTEKDFVKIRELTSSLERFIPVEMTANFVSEPRTLNDFFDKLSGL